MAKKLSETVKLNLRFSEELRRKLEKAAVRNNQSMNLEIVDRLEASFTLEEMNVLLERKIEQVIEITQLKLKMSEDIWKKALQQNARDTVKATLAWVNEQRAEEEAERNRTSNSADLSKPDGSDK